jgi:hypothetical protein
MGTGHSIDTPIRVAHLGINSVISIVDDLLVEKIREHYSRLFDIPYKRILRYEIDGRARRITAYLDTVKEIVHRKFEQVKQLPFFQKNDKSKYFELLPITSPLRQEYDAMLSMPEGAQRNAVEKSLTERMRPGSIDANIMVKLDKVNHTKGGMPLSDEFSDAKAALRGFANSAVESSLVLSAGINQSLFGYMTKFKEFYRTETGYLKKKIILKVSDFRSAFIQGKVLAKKGLEVYEFRIESGLNCGGHAFASNGELLPSLLKEFKERREQLAGEFEPMIRRFYESMGWQYPDAAKDHRALVTVQGGIGTHGEVRRLREEYGMDMTGLASPFLLVPEATCVDDATRELLMKATEEDLYLSDVSPLGIPFNNVRNTGSEKWTRSKAESGKPGSACPKGFLVSNTEYTQKPICLASTEYQDQKLKEVEESNLSDAEKAQRWSEIVVKSCICDHLGNGALIALGILPEHKSPQSICPGPNIAWFNRLYSLQEMVDHIYGRSQSLVPAHRPHMFAKEIVMYVDYFGKLVEKCGFTPNEIKTLREYVRNMEEGIAYCLEIADSKAYPDENLASIRPIAEEQLLRLRELNRRLEEMIAERQGVEAVVA